MSAKLKYNHSLKCKRQDKDTTRTDERRDDAREISLLKKSLEDFPISD